jgi:hypothetical protein
VCHDGPCISSRLVFFIYQLVILLCYLYKDLNIPASAKRCLYVETSLDGHAIRLKNTARVAEVAGLYPNVVASDDEFHLVKLWHGKPRHSL